MPDTPYGQAAARVCVGCARARGAGVPACGRLQQCAILWPGLREALTHPRHAHALLAHWMAGKRLGGLASHLPAPLSAIGIMTTSRHGSVMTQ